MNTPIERAEHEEFRKRMEEENKRQDRRIELLENNVKEIGDLSVSVKELATSMKHMCQELEAQGIRLEALEGRDGKMWRTVLSHIATTVVGIVIAWIFVQLGM